MFFVKYLGCELGKRTRQAVFIALGLALGIGLVITVTAASTGVKKAQSTVLQALYGIGTDVTVAAKAPPPSNTPPAGRVSLTPSGVCVYNAAGQCKNAAGQTIDNLNNRNLGTLSAASVAKVANLPGVASATGSLALNDSRFTLPASTSGSSPGGFGNVNPTSFSVDGVDLSHLHLGPLSDGHVTSGHSLASSDGAANVAVVDSNYAIANRLKVGSSIKIAGTPFKVIGVVSQPQGSNPVDAYIPLQRAQALGKDYQGKSLTGEVNTIYVSATSAAVIPSVQRKIAALLPSATITTASSLASQVTGSLANTSKLANTLGTWLSILVLIAAFVLASLLTLGAVARRVAEFGTLKALGWRSSRIVAQVMGESVTIGIIGGLVGIGVGFAGAALVAKLTPPMSATVGSGSGGLSQSTNAAGEQIHTFTPNTSHTVPIHLVTPVTVSALVLAVVLAVAGGLLAGSIGSWRAARLSPAMALRQT
jgi:putative ABC transport system permease protein